MNPNEPAPNVQPTQPLEAPTFTPGIQNAQPLAPQPAPEPAQPAQPEPTQPVDPAPQPTDPQQPAPQPSDPNAPAQPTQPVEQPAQPALNYDEYLDSLIEKAGHNQEIKVPTPPTQEQLESDDQALTKFFSELVDTAVQKAVNEGNKQTTIRAAEAEAWQGVFTKYPEIKESKGLRDTIHNIRIGAYQRGQALSPIQVADQLIGDLHNQYKRGVNDTNVTTTIRDSQPLGGGNTPPAQTAVNFTSLQDGGQLAAVAELTKLIEQNKI